MCIEGHYVKRKRFKVWLNDICHRAPEYFTLTMFLSQLDIWWENTTVRLVQAEESLQGMEGDMSYS